MSISVHDYLYENKAQSIGILQELVRIPTVNPPGERYSQMVDLICEICRNIGLKVDVHVVPDIMVKNHIGCTDWPRYNVLARWDIGAKETVHFNAHYDVVPVGGRWKFSNPFNPIIDGDYLYGRGTADMKGSIGALLSAIVALKKCRIEPAFNIECSFTADEETGGYLGAGEIIREGLCTADFAVVCEGAGGTKVGCGHNGVLWLEVNFEGKSSHASSPENGVNAFEAMAEVANGLQQYKEALDEKLKTYTDFDGVCRNPSITIGGVFGGNQGHKINTVPASARFSIDRRLVPGENIKNVESDLRSEIDILGQAALPAKVCTKTVMSIDSCVVNPAGSLCQGFGSAIGSVRRSKVYYGITSGFTDLHYFIVDAGIPGIGYGVKGEGIHGVDERVRISDFIMTARTYAEFIQRGVED